MEKIKFMSEEMQETDFYVLEQTKVNGVSYILVTDSEEDDAECLILKDTQQKMIGKCLRDRGRCDRAWRGFEDI